jgi:hypothetical protein
VAHVGRANVLLGSFLLFVPPTLLWFVFVAGSIAGAASVACAALFSATTICLVLAHLTEPGILPTQVVGVANSNGVTVRVVREARVRDPRPWLTCSVSHTVGEDRYQPRKVVSGQPRAPPCSAGRGLTGGRGHTQQFLGCDEHELEDFRAKVRAPETGRQPSL